MIKAVSLKDERAILVGSACRTNPVTTLSELTKRELERTVQRPATREWFSYTERTRPISSKRTAVQIVRELRDARASH